MADLFGSQGNNTLVGFDTDDRILSDAGNDTFNDEAGDAIISESGNANTKSRSATIFKPNQGDTFSLLGNTITCKFDRHVQGARIYELVGTATSGVPPLHTHPWDKWFYFLEGDVAFQVADQVVQATPGDVIHLPAGVAHTFRVKSPQAKFLVGVSNAAAEQYLKELAEAAQQQELTPAEMMAIAQKHHIRPVLADS